MQPIERAQIQAFLSSLPFVEDSVRDTLLSSAQISRHQKGELIIVAGQDAYQPSILLSGLIRVFFLNAAGAEVTNLFILEKTFYGADFLTMKKASVCSFEALEDCVSLVLNREVLQSVLKQNIRLLLAYTGVLEQSLNRKILRENALITKTATERYLALKHAYPQIEKRVNQTQIASYLGITPVSLSRIRRGIREEN
ncbi:MAG TPA: Crp/Fnr family transcriptional regulator [Ruminococcaceae bacterium]|nr:Crp/Fnr family transcriptional regulator [Oscillospiraceae bacterium]